MRVIAGTYRSRPLAAPRGSSTRPTYDRLRETLFNVLAPRISGANFADLYAGSGSVGIEALSRGAREVTFVENAPAALDALRGNLQSLRITSGYCIERRALPGALRTLAENEPHWDILFLDPPYELTDAYAGTLALVARHASALLAPDALVVAEHRRRSPTLLAASFDALTRYRLLEQGDAALSFFRMAEPPAAPTQP